MWPFSSAGKITIYADFIDPFCYLGFYALKPLAEQRQLKLEWKGFEFNPDTPAEPLSLETAGNSDLRPGMWASVKDLALKSGLDLPEPQWVPNTRGAHALVYLGEKAGVKNPLIERIYQAYFNRQLDISRIDVLIDLASAFSISARSLQSLISDPEFARLLEGRRTEAQKRRFLGMPGFIYKGAPYFGALSREAWDEIFRGGLHRGR